MSSSWFKREYAEKIWENHIKHMATGEIIEWLIKNRIGFPNKWKDFITLGESEWCDLYFKNASDISISIQEVLNAIAVTSGKGRRRATTYLCFPVAYIHQLANLLKVEYRPKDKRDEILKKVLKAIDKQAMQF